MKTNLQNEKQKEPQFILRQVMNRLSISEVELGIRLGISRQAVNKILKGDPRASRIIEIAKALEISPRELFSA